MVALLRIVEREPAPYGTGPDVDDAWFGIRSGDLTIVPADSATR